MAQKFVSLFFRRSFRGFASLTYRGSQRNTCSMLLSIFDIAVKSRQRDSRKQRNELLCHFFGEFAAKPPSTQGIFCRSRLTGADKVRARAAALPAPAGSRCGRANSELAANRQDCCRLERAIHRWRSHLSAWGKAGKGDKRRVPFRYRCLVEGREGLARSWSGLVPSERRRLCSHGGGLARFG